MMFYQQGSLVINDKQFAFMERGLLEDGQGGGSHIGISLYRLDKTCFLCMHVPNSKCNKEVCDIREV